jgi:hypothetical protein
LVVANQWCSGLGGFNPNNGDLLIWNPIDLLDDDGDGFTSSDGDCNESNPLINPETLEACDGLDNNCNSLIDEGFDVDLDGVNSCSGDCDDLDATIYPGAIDLDDGIDNNCDGLIDENFDSDGDGVTPADGDCDDTNPLRNLTNPCESVVTVKMIIEGYYDTDTQAMRPVMLNQGVGISATDVDTVTIELRDATTYELVTSTTAMLQTNGNAVASFTTAPSGSFYIVVKHRNALETWSANPVTVGASPSTYDFTTSSDKAYGDNMKMLALGVYGFYSGDINQDGFIEGLDYAPLFNDSDNLLEGFQTTDLNGDGYVEGLDYPFLFNNSDALIELLRP